MGGGKCAKAAGRERHVYITRTSQVSFDDCQQRSRFRDGNSRLLLGSNVELDRKLGAGSSRTSLPYGPRTQPAKHNFARVFLIQQKQATDVQIRRNWILTSTLSTYLSAMRETMKAYAHTRPFTFGISGAQQRELSVS
ncbi:hypothetical protein ALC60_02983 [Trachymyrmex zeteki]|uniref:Uncharacterized protein n=1 Tax=Mycetomoellerius zeteki TaxID=64791 RepID=A0A151XC48_9HYME|nr:hypothetical protein ALC60_02983 [Trachymyrmex zeteki]